MIDCMHPLFFKHLFIIYELFLIPDFYLFGCHFFTGCSYSYRTSSRGKSIFLLKINMIVLFINMNHYNSFSFIKFKFWTNFILWIRFYLACNNIGYFSKYFINFIHTNYNAIIFCTNKNCSTIAIKERCYFFCNCISIFLFYNVSDSMYLLVAILFPYSHHTIFATFIKCKPTFYSRVFMFHFRKERLTTFFNT